MKKRLYTFFRILSAVLAFSITAAIILDLCGIIDLLAYQPHLVINILLFVLLIILCALPQFLFRRERQTAKTKRELEAEKEFLRSIREGSDVTVWKYELKNDQLSMLIPSKDGTKHFEPLPDFRNSIISGIVHPDYQDTILRYPEEILNISFDEVYEFRALRPDGEYGWYSLTVTEILREDDKPVGALLKSINIDVELDRKDKLRANANTDALTGLCNRYSLEAQIGELLDANPLKNHALAVINIDDYTLIHDRLGSKYATALLSELAALLPRILPENCIIGRIGGDMFVAFIPDIRSDRELYSYGEKISTCIKRSITLGENGLQDVTCSIGFAKYPRNASTFEDLFFKADTALCDAKLKGHGNYSMYREDMENSISDQIEDLKVLAEDHFVGSQFHSDSLINKVIEILFDSRDLDSSISLILSLIGHKYNLDHACIFEFSDDYTSAYRTHEWSDRSCEPLNTRTKQIPMELAEKITFCIDSDYFACDDLDEYCSSKPDILDFYHSLGARALLQCTILENGVCCGHINFFVGSGDRMWSENDINDLLLISKTIGGYLVTLRSRQDASRTAKFDHLTGAWNLSYFIAQGREILDSNPDKQYCILYSDIDRFKYINEKYGYAIGNELLIRYAQVLGEHLDDNDEAFARVSADHFVSLVKYDSSLEERFIRFDRAVNSIKRTENSYFKLSVRTGVYIIPEDQSGDITTYIEKAIMACSSLRNQHRSSFAYFDKSMKETLSKQKEIEEVMQEALDNGEFVVYYQPKFSLADKNIVGAEALIRWNRPGIGLVSPADFIPLFEDNGFVVKIDFFVLESVCKKLRSDIDSGLPVTPISVNFSRVHLSSPDFINRISECIERYDVPSHLIEIEITESALTGNEDYLLEIMKSLHRLGIVISMDDFGSGYSSLNLLKKLPFDALKIDKEFFANTNATERDRTIIASVVNMAKSLNIRVVSEGVETNEQADFLRAINCDQAQGFLYAGPMDIDSFRTRYQQIPTGA